MWLSSLTMASLVNNAGIGNGWLVYNIRLIGKCRAVYTKIMKWVTNGDESLFKTRKITLV